MPSNNPIVLDDLGQHTEVVPSKLTGQFTIRPDMVPLVNGDRTAGLKSLIDAAVASGTTLIRLAAGTYDGIGKLDTADGSVLELAPGAVLLPRPLTSAEKSQEAADVTNAGPDYYWPIVNLGNGARIHGGGQINGLKSIRPFANGVRVLNRAGRSRIRLEIYNCGGDGVLFIGSHQVQVERCDIHDNDGRGIHGVISNNARINQNRVDNVQHGIQWWGDTTNGICTGWSITGNVITNAVNTTQGGSSVPGGGGIWGHLGQRITVTGNTIDSCDDVGIDFETCYDSSASGNIVSNCKNAALAVFLASKRIAFTGNIVSQGAGMGPGVKAYGPSGINTDVTIRGGSITTTDASADGIFTLAGVCEDLTVDGVTIICNGGAIPINSQDCHRTQVINCPKLQTTGGLGLDMRGGSNGRAEGNTLYYTGTDSANARGIRVYWRPNGYSAKNNIIRRNRLINFGAGIYDDNNGDAASGNIFEENITPSVTVNIAAGWTGRRRGNRNDAGVFCDGSTSNTLPDGFAPKAAGRLTWTGTGFDSVVETLTGITGGTAGTFYIPVLTLPASSGGTYDHSLFQVSLGKWAGNTKKVYTVKAGQRDVQSTTYTCHGNHSADGTLMAFQDTAGITTFYLVVGQYSEYGVRYLILNQSTPASTLVSSTSAPTGTKVFDSSVTPPVAEFGDTMRTKGLDVQTKRAYTPASAADATGTTGDITYDANNLYLKAAGGWIGTPMFSIGGFPMGIPVQTKTFSGIQAVYDAIPAGTTATILLTGDYIRDGSTSLSITNANKTVWFRSYTGATLRDNNNTQSAAPLALINNQTGGGWENVGFYTASNYQAFNYGVVFVNETAPVVNYTFRRVSVSCPNLKGNGITVQAWSDDNNGGAGGGCIHRNITFDDCDLRDVGRMGIEITCHNEKESGVPTRIFGTTIRNSRVTNTGLQTKDGMGISYSGSLEDVINLGNRLDGCKQYFVEFIGVRSATTGNNVMINGKTWGDGSQGSGTNLTNGYNFTDGNNSGLGAKNITISNDEISTNGRPYLAYGCSHLTFNGGVWRGGLAIDINRGSKSDGSGQQTTDLTMQGVDVVIAGSAANNVLVVNNSARCQFLNLNLTLNNPTVASNYSVINVYSNCDRVLLSGGSWRRPAGSQDSMYNMTATNSPAVGTHLESTF